MNEMLHDCTDNINADDDTNIATSSSYLGCTRHRRILDSVISH